MKALILLLFVSTSVFAEVNDRHWVVNANNQPVVISENMLGSRKTVVGYDVCNGILQFYDEQYEDSTEKTSVPVRIKVDDSIYFYTAELSITSDFFHGGKRRVFLGATIEKDLLKEMIEGNKMRVQYKDNYGWSDKIIERYTLKNFTASAHKALQNCPDEDSTYFQTKSDADFF